MRLSSERRGEEERKNRDPLVCFTLDEMHLHQILTGAANPSDYSFAAGSIESVHFVVSQSCVERGEHRDLSFEGLRSWVQYRHSIG